MDKTVQSSISPLLLLVGTPSGPVARAGGHILTTTDIVPVRTMGEKERPWRGGFVWLLGQC